MGINPIGNQPFMVINPLWDSTLFGNQPFLGINPAWESTLFGNQPFMGINPVWESTLFGNQPFVGNLLWMVITPFDNNTTPKPTST